MTTSDTIHHEQRRENDVLRVHGNGGVSVAGCVRQGLANDLHVFGGDGHWSRGLGGESLDGAEARQLVYEENIKLSSDARDSLRDETSVGGYLSGAADADAAERGFDAREQRRGRGDVGGGVRLLEHGE
jgi:hypothetical protein